MLLTVMVLLETIVFHTRETAQTVEGVHRQAKAEFHQRREERLQLMREICAIREVNLLVTAGVLQSVA